VWWRQNKIISDLTHPPRSHPALPVAPEVTTWYLKKFDLLPAPYRADEDVWFRYAKPEHVKAWADLLRRVIPASIAAIEATRTAWPCREVCSPDAYVDQTLPHAR
jgi:hypothetical protein